MKISISTNNSVKIKGIITLVEKAKKNLKKGKAQMRLPIMLVKAVGLKRILTRMKRKTINALKSQQKKLWRKLRKKI